MTTIGYFTIWARPHTDLMLFRQEPCHYKFGIKTLSPISKQKDTLEASRCFILSIKVVENFITFKSLGKYDCKQKKGDFGVPIIRN